MAHVLGGVCRIRLVRVLWRSFALLDPVLHVVQVRVAPLADGARQKRRLSAHLFKNHSAVLHQTFGQHRPEDQPDEGPDWQR